MTEDEIEGLAYDCYGCNCGLYLKAFVDGFKKSKEILLNTISNILKK